MSEPPVVDASPLIVLAQAERFDLLRVAGDRILVPRPVALEVLRPGSPDAAAAAIRSSPWITVVDAGSPPDAVRQQRLDPGEEAVLTWALAHPGTAAIIDDRRGRRAAAALGIPVIGLLGIILDAKRVGMIPAARPVVEHLLTTTDWYISAELVERVLARVGE